MNVKLISITPDAEKTMAYVARVSNPSNQENPNYAKLLGYCIQHNHWSVFEQAFMTVEINTTRGLAAQILRHRSFTFQEFSQRFAARIQRIVRTLPMILKKKKYLL
jgi:thymidylate synthase (FAD)